MKYCFSALLCLLFLFATLSSCKTNKGCTAHLGEISQCRYYFLDGSVPPMYHRSYSIDVNFNNDSLSYSIDAYGDTLLQIQIALQDSQHTQLLALCKALKTPKDMTLNQMVGGPSQDLLIKDKADKQFRLHWNTDNSPSTQQLIDYLHSLVPQHKELMAKTQIEDLLVFVYYGDAIPEDHQNIDSICKPFGFKLERLGEETVSDELAAKVATDNALVSKLMELQMGKDWRERFEKETDKNLSVFNCFK